MVRALVLAIAFLAGVVATPPALAAPAETHVPFTLEANHIVVGATIDGFPTRAVLDTGAANIVTPEFAAAHHLVTHGHFRVGGVGETREDASATTIDRVSVGDASLVNQRFTVLALPPTMRGQRAVPVDAILGTEFFHAYAVRFDFAHGELTAIPAARFTYAGNGTAVPTRFLGTTPMVAGTVDGIAGEFTLDTGSSASLTLTQPFVERNHLHASLAKTGDVVFGRGVGGFATGELGRAHVVTLGEVRVLDPVVELAQSERGYFASDRIAGNVGIDVLARFTVTFDEAAGTVWFERTPQSDQPRPYNRAGMYVQRDEPSRVDVVSVLAQGPADEAGIAAGDRIVAIDGTPVSALPYDEVWRLLHGEPGTTHRLAVVHDGTTVERTLRLRDLV